MKLTKRKEAKGTTSKTWKRSLAHATAHTTLSRKDDLISSSFRLSRFSRVLRSSHPFARSDFGFVQTVSVFRPCVQTRVCVCDCDFLQCLGRRLLPHCWHFPASFIAFNERSGGLDAQPFVPYDMISVILRTFVCLHPPGFVRECDRTDACT